MRVLCIEGLRDEGIVSTHVSVLSLQVKIFAFNKVLIPTITCFHDLRLLTLTFLLSLLMAHTHQDKDKTRVVMISNRLQIQEQCLGLTIEVYQVKKHMPFLERALTSPNR